MSKTLELRVLDDEELLDVVGGCYSPCRPRYNPCDRRDEDCGGFEIDINIDVVICL